jgi:hypothetical protein
MFMCNLVWLYWIVHEVHLKPFPISANILYVLYIVAWGSNNLMGSHLLCTLCCPAIFMISRDFHLAKAKFNCDNPVFSTLWLRTEPPECWVAMIFWLHLVCETYTKPRRSYCDICRAKLCWTCGFSPRALLAKNKSRIFDITIFIPTMLYFSKASPPH